MSDITQLAWLRIMFGARILRITLLGFAITALQSSTVQAQWAGPTNNNLTTTNNVGIGTTAPAGILHVKAATNDTLLVRGHLNLNDGTSLYAVNEANNAVKGMEFGASSYYFAGGNFGIGTGSPTSKLHVQGDGKVTGNLVVDGNISAKFQDVAEWVESSQALQAGTVVVLDHTKSNQVVASSESYDTRVAGVISTQPGITLGEAGENKVLVATTGRVRIKVDASHGPIQVGDLLVTSDIPGLAMKSQPVSVGGVQLHRPGTLLGKALEPLQKGTGEILVLLSLQ